MSDADDEKKLEKIFAILREPDEDAAAKDALLDRKWPQLVANARREAEEELAARRARRWKIVTGLAVAATLFVAGGLALHFLPEGPHHPDDMTKGDEVFLDLARKETLEACWREVGFDSSQREASAKIAQDYKNRVDVAAVRSEIRPRLAALLDEKQRERFAKFCAARDEKR